MVEAGVVHDDADRTLAEVVCASDDVLAAGEEVVHDDDPVRIPVVAEVEEAAVVRTVLESLHCPR